MFDIEFKKLSSSDLEKVYEIDRSESVDTMYRTAGDELEAYDDSIEISTDPAIWKKLLVWWRSELKEGAEAFGAFDGETLTGIAIIKHGIREGVDQIIAMYVSAEYRLSGIARSLYFELEDSAKAAGAKQLFVCTEPTGSAVGFYLSQGFQFDAGSACSIDQNEESEIPMVKRLKR
ncbi:GNAT family N-acetyltransferase [Pelagicoccus sp. NFK12]|uniref:GNAT family N-acetyltransferase n=1 Tax=Pelagicoccus enzymogenes TaxID=2773457 RepID=A0A927IHC1_9BACT|nr:GNAT family N-acetyltransferase [Pelagicoccus enzymogenes]MBD5779295.1 GNAT family N-acetyltransferase [Pelagicoccus enzymogenes]MDQ8198353.1 GNAT family N-acetyltransferase [Pelagicoccus enzymogenes]